MDKADMVESVTSLRGQVIFVVDEAARACRRCFSTPDAATMARRCRDNTRDAAKR